MRVLPQMASRKPIILAVPTETPEEDMVLQERKWYPSF